MKKRRKTSVLGEKERQFGISRISDFSEIFRCKVTWTRRWDDGIRVQNSTHSASKTCPAGPLPGPKDSTLKPQWLWVKELSTRVTGFWPTVKCLWPKEKLRSNAPLRILEAQPLTCLLRKRQASARVESSCVCMCQLVLRVLSANALLEVTISSVCMWHSCVKKQPAVEGES